MLSLPLSSAVGNAASLGLSHLLLVGRWFLNLGCRHGVCGVGICWEELSSILARSCQCLSRAFEDSGNS